MSKQTRNNKGQFKAKVTKSVTDYQAETIEGMRYDIVTLNKQVKELTGLLSQAVRHAAETDKNLFNGMDLIKQEYATKLELIQHRAQIIEMVSNTALKSKVEVLAGALDAHKQELKEVAEMARKGYALSDSLADTIVRMNNQIREDKIGHFGPEYFPDDQDHQTSPNDVK